MAFFDRRTDQEERADDDKLGLLKLMDRRRQASLKAKREFNRKTYVCVAFYMGEQYSYWNRVLNNIVEIDRQPGETIRVVVNLLATFADAIISVLDRGRPKPEVLPNSSTSEDIARAKISTKAFNWLYQNRINMDMINQSVYKWMCLTGNGFKYIYWDPDGGEYTGKKEVVDEEGNVTKVLYEGEIAVESLDPRLVHFDYTKPSCNESNWVIIDSVRSRDYLKAMYPEKAHHISYTKSIDRENEGYERRIQRLSGLNTEGLVEESTMVHYMYERPTDRYPEGRYIVASGNVILREDNKLPYDHMYLPIIHYQYTNSPASPWANGPCERMLSPQREYNKVMTQLIMNKDLMAKLKYLVPRGADLSETSLDDVPGEVIYYNFGFEPKQLNVTGLPAYVMQTLDRILADFQEISGIREITKGYVPPGVESGAAIRLLDEQASSRFAGIIAGIFRSERMVAKQMLGLMKQFYREPRMLRLVGENKEAELLEFKASEHIDSDYDITFSPGSALTLSRTAKFSEIMTMIGNGTIDVQNPEEKRKALEAIDFGDVSIWFEHQTTDDQKAKRIIHQLSRGQQPEPKEWENHKIILNAIQNEMNKPQFEVEDPQIQQLFITQWQMRRQIVKQEEALQIGLQQNIPGQPAPEGQLQGGPVLPQGGGQGQTDAGTQSLAGVAGGMQGEIPGPVV